MTTKPTSVTKSEAITHTKNWLNTVIIEHSICPFAKREFVNNTIHYELIQQTGEGKQTEQQLEQLIINCEKLDNDASIETALLIFPDSLSDFDDYLDFVEIADALMHKQGYEGIYQLASFHPQYLFADSDENDPSNYTNRSPYPMLHILREASLEKVLESYPNPENIPERNIELTRSLGLETMQKLLAECI
ncbi:DUF1415 domain-containing protein [Cocleimonas flava]|nr:DUF1415 domain-containing protein [Cocleimonas flava]